MKKRILFISVLSIAVMWTYSCVYPFSVVPDSSWESVLSVEGSIVVGGPSEFYFTRTIEIDSPEDNINYEWVSSIWIEDDGGNHYILSTIYDNNVIKYVYNGDLEPDRKYKLCFVRDGKNYESTLQEVLISPAIDSITYNIYEHEKLRLFVNSQGDDGYYYKWTYKEVWDDRAIYLSAKIPDPINGYLGIYLPPPPLNEDPRAFCCKYYLSDEILIGDPALFDKAYLKEYLIKDIHYNDRRISKLYSIDLSQRKISKEEFTYWNSISKNSEEVGGIFSQLPSELKGNISCLNDPEEIVLGYIGAATVSMKRKFIATEEISLYRRDLNWCEDPKEVIPEKYAKYVTSNKWVPWGDDVLSMLMVRLECADCRLLGGCKDIPDYWPLKYN